MYSYLSLLGTLNYNVPIILDLQYVFRLHPLEQSTKPVHCLSLSVYTQYISFPYI